MTARRALVVDDSRSARAFLTRILERYELAVDGVESAEQAIEYLTRQRPDVIFMDHLMPGMDGFQAVQAIKNNPLTATIPIMMYTSQEGELYLSQARALGAIGVLPKQTKPTDVSKALEQLRLIGEPRTDGDMMFDYPEIFAESDAETVRVRPAQVAAVGAGPPEDTADFDLPGGSEISPEAVPVTGTGAVGGSGAAAGAASGVGVFGSFAAAAALAAGSGSGSASAGAAGNGGPPPKREGPERRGTSRPNLPAMPPELRSIVEAMVAHHMRNLQRFIAENLETQADRMVGDVRLMLKDQAPPSMPMAPVPEPPRTSNGFWLGLFGVMLACFVGWQWYQQRMDTASLSAQLAQSQQDLASMREEFGMPPSESPAPVTAPAAAQAARSGAGASAAEPADNVIVEPVPYGELPLAGARLERIQSLLARLNSQGFRGQVEIRAIPGRFCMISGASATPMLASDVVPYSKCDQVGNPRDDNGSVSARQSVAFANMIAAARQGANGKFDIQIGSGSADDTVAAYPPVTDSLSAGEWNRAAAANNRVEVHWRAGR
jgi:CheY-like chemotaxis protein